MGEALEQWLWEQRVKAARGELWCWKQSLWDYKQAEVAGDQRAKELRVEAERQIELLERVLQELGAEEEDGAERVSYGGS